MAVRRDAPRDPRTERIERVEVHHDTAVTPAAPATNVNVGPATPATDAVAIVTRVVMLIITVFEALLLFRVVFKLAGANSSQPLIAALYGFTEPLVRPFQGIFPEPKTAGVVVDVAALLAIVFLFLVGWLIVAIVRAIAGRTV